MKRMYVVTTLFFAIGGAYAQLTRAEVHQQLYMFADRCMVEEIRYLMHQGVNPNDKAARSSGGKTPLHIAAHRKCAGAVRMLLNVAEDPSMTFKAAPNIEDNEKKTPLDYAKSADCAECVRLLKATGGK